MVLSKDPKIEYYNQDCMTAMQEMKDNAFDLAIVDPPYGIDIAKHGSLGNDTFTSKEWDKNRPDKDYFIELQRVSINQIIWGWNYYSDLLPACKAPICWNKLNHHNNRSDLELAYTSFDKLAKYFEYMWDGNRYGTKGNIQGVGKPTIRIHPTQKPVQLYKWLLDNYTQPGDKILDTHAGSLSIGIACHQMGFDLTAYELDADYYRDSIKRFKENTIQMSMFTK